ncbi:MAG TPA: type 4a pilus biogenesis protein PilO [bacterium]|nr:MAG: Pilus assembly protein, PilO [Parcubacteria group bacterium ADurb.Bin192]HPN15277.1 type 4a pilus biogenesis protein PilO [bacterium]
MTEIKEEASQQPSPQTEDKKTPAVKTPSKLFTDYYGTIFLLLIALYVAAGFFVIKPKIDYNKQVEVDTLALRQEIENERFYFDGLSRSVAAAQAISPEVLDRVDKALPREVSVPELLVILSGAARISQVELNNLIFENSSAAVPGTKGPLPLNITMSVGANNYLEVKNFLRVLENSLRIFDVQNINVTGLDQEKTNFSLQLKTYYYPAVKEDVK